MTYILAAVGAISLASCDDFLDKLPDNRIDPDTPELLAKVLADGYTASNHGTMCELSSDNIVDNHAPLNGLSYPTLPANDPIDDQIFAWEDADMNSMQDSPTAIWQGCYSAIASANHVLAKVAELRASGGYANNDQLDAVYGEALLIRAFHHFILVNMFSPAWRGDEQSAQDMGIPYATEPETTVHVNYPRESVKAVYDKIEADLLEGLKYQSDQYYTVPKYHFNKNAANAFAARFYLYKRDYEKVEQYATAAIGSDPAQVLRSTYWNTDYTSLDADNQGYYSSSSANNFMLIATNSVQFYTICFNSSGSGSRYALNRDAATSTLYGSGPTWNNYIPAIASHLYVNAQQDYGLWPSWMYMQFQYVDKVARIGYPRLIRAEFTGEETLLMRAEARIYLGNLPGAVSDLNYWQKAFGSDMPELTAALVESYYNPQNATTSDSDPRPYNLLDLHIDDVCPSSYKVTETMKPYLWCVLHFRRIETVMTGMRWFDIKRYGLEITHKIGTSRVETLSYADPRMAFQVPIESISAGMTPTDRTVPKVSESSLVKFVIPGNPND